jgi:hypothetical protein
LEVLTRTGFVRRAVPVGAPRGAQGIYEIGDPYLAFWFGILYSDIPLIEGGQGRQVLRRKAPQWQRQLGWVFEEAARAHAQRLVARGALPEDIVIGRWWATSGQQAEVDVLGLRGSRTVLAGSAKWQGQPLGVRELEALRRQVPRAPNPAEEVILALWGQGGVGPEVERVGALGFDADDIVSD